MNIIKILLLTIIVLVKPLHAEEINAITKVAIDIYKDIKLIEYIGTIPKLTEIAILGSYSNIKNDNNTLYYIKSLEFEGWTKSSNIILKSTFKRVTKFNEISCQACQGDACWTEKINSQGQYYYERYNIETVPCSKIEKMGNNNIGKHCSGWKQLYYSNGIYWRKDYRVPTDQYLIIESNKMVFRDYLCEPQF